MTGFEKEILEHVRQHPGCERVDLLATIRGDKNAANEIDCMVIDGKLCRWYNDMVPRYYIPGPHRPEHLTADTDGTQEGTIPLAAGLHRDGTIHIYVKGKDSGLSVGRLDDGTLIVKVDESKRVMKVGGRD